jgi:hypothetical protein
VAEHRYQAVLSVISDRLAIRQAADSSLGRSRSVPAGVERGDRRHLGVNDVHRCLQ